MDKAAMRRIDVASSNIKSIGHNFLTKNMEIEFKGGNIYRYKKVPRKVFKDMLGADSKGKFFWHNVRFEYPYKKYRDKNGEKVKGEWKMLEKKEQEKTASAKTTIAGAIVGGVGGGIRGFGSEMLNGDKKPLKQKIKKALKKGAAEGAIGAAAGAGVGATNDVLKKTLLKKSASDVLDEMYKEAAMLTGTGAMFGVNSVMKNLGNAYNKGAGGMIGKEARKAGMRAVGESGNKIIRRAAGAAVAGNLLEKATEGLTTPTYEDDYGRRVAASEILDDLYEKSLNMEY